MELSTFLLQEQDWHLSGRREGGQTWFSADDLAQNLGHADTSMMVKPVDQEYVQLMRMGTAGGPQTKLALTEEGVYWVVMRSRKASMAPFRKWVLGALKQLRQTGRYDMAADPAGEAERSGATLHTALVRGFAHTNCVYLAWISGSVYKIGYSELGMESRSRQQIQYFGTFQLVHCEHVTQPHQYEQWLLHRHPDIVARKVPEVNGVRSTELVRLDEVLTLEALIAIFKSRAADFKERTPAQREFDQRLAMGLVQVERERIWCSLPEKDRPPFPSAADLEVNVEARGRKRLTDHAMQQKIQQYDLDLVYLDTYESIADASHAIGRHRDFVSKDADDNTADTGFRWLKVTSDFRVPRALEPTVQRVKRRTGMVASLDKDKTRILHPVFDNAKAAGISAGYRNGDAIWRAIERDQKKGDFFWVKWDDCRDELKTAYVAEHGDPLEDKGANSGKRVRQLDPSTRELVDVHQTMSDVTLRFGPCCKTLKKAIDDDRVLKGYRWEFEV